jgi:predicted nuclease of predicted toxin-antitoxin system
VTKLKLDENLPRDALLVLQAAGYDALSVFDQRLGGVVDQVLFDVCRAEGRTIVTLDLDFSNVRVFNPTGHPGVIVLRPHSQDVVSIVALVKRMLVALASEPIAGTLWIVEDDRIRFWAP